MSFELSKECGFEAAHTLRREIDGASSRRIHGHSYRVEVTIAGEADPATGMVADLGLLERRLREIAGQLDHRLLDEVEGLGSPTMEHLAGWIWTRLARDLPRLAAVTVRRDSLGERCVYRGPRAA